MVPKHHPTPLSGGDRKALNKEPGPLDDIHRLPGKASTSSNSFLTPRFKAELAAISAEDLPNNCPSAGNVRGLLRLFERIQYIRLGAGLRKLSSRRCHQTPHSWVLCLAR
jgi:hypothetical protein